VSEFGDALGGHDRASLEEYLEVVDLDVVGGEARQVLRLYSSVSYLETVGM
jgi:hypothetical protein